MSSSKHTVADLLIENQKLRAKNAKLVARNKAYKAELARLSIARMDEAMAIFGENEPMDLSDRNGQAMDQSDRYFEFAVEQYDGECFLGAFDWAKISFFFVNFSYVSFVTDSLYFSSLFSRNSICFTQVVWMKSPKLTKLQRKSIAVNRNMKKTVGQCGKAFNDVKRLIERRFDGAVEPITFDTDDIICARA